MHSTQERLGYPPYEDFESPENVETWANAIAAMLALSNDPAHQRLAKRLASCRVDSLCHSGACPRCERLQRLDWIQTLDATVKTEWAGKPGEIGFLSIVLPHLLIAPGKLLTLDIVDLWRQIAALLDRAGLREVEVLGGIDFALTHWKIPRMEAWQPHFHGIVHAPMGLAIMLACLELYLPPTELVATPVHLQPVRDKLASAAGYTRKSYFDSRHEYISSTTGLVRAHHLPLSEKDLRELALVLDHIELGNRVFQKDRFGLRPGWDSES